MKSATSTCPEAEMDDDIATSPVLARADALMQRRRQNAAAEFEDVPVLTEVIAPDDDVPVITDVVREEAQAEPEIGPAVLRILADELADEVRRKLAAEIPSLVEASLQSLIGRLSEDLRHGVTESADEALRDFLARREKLARQQQR